MWRLTIYQTKPYDTFTSKQEIVYESENIEDLLLEVANLSKLGTTKKTWYEIRKVEENKATTEGEEE